MGTHFRSPDVLITDDAIAVRVPMWRRFKVRDLRDPEVVVFPARWWIGTRVYELHVTYCNHRICLLRTSDAIVFGKVRRALARAFERDRERLEQYGMSTTVAPYM